MEFDLLSNSPKIFHRLFLRHGGVSENEFHSLNAAYEIGDKIEHVDENISTIRKNLSYSKLIWAKQCHGTNILPVSLDSHEKMNDCDGFITNQAKTALMIKHADCQAAIFYDPINHALANIHSGWRGSVQNIYSKTIDLMHKTYGSKPKNILVCISPSLGPKFAEFSNYKKELPKDFWDFQDMEKHFNFWEISRMQLKKKGILPQHIEIAEICTFEEKKDFFSFRREKKTGRHGCVAMLLK